MGIPRSQSDYWCMYSNLLACPTVNPPLNDYIPFDGGAVNLDQKLNRFLVNGVLGKNICHYEYKPRNGFLKTGKSAYLPHYFSSNEILVPGFMHFQAMTPTLSARTDLEFKSLTKDFKEKGATIKFAQSYKAKIETPYRWDPIAGTYSIRAQPQLHIGMFAIPAINPASENEDFTNACMYLEVSCKMYVETDYESMYTEKSLSYWPEQIVFADTMHKKYTSGSCAYGGIDLHAGGDISGTSVSDVNEGISNLNFSKTVHYDVPY